MKVSKRLIAYAVKFLGVKAGSDNAVVRAAVAKALNEKKLSPEKLVKLNTPKTKAAVLVGAGAAAGATGGDRITGHDDGLQFSSASQFMKGLSDVRVKEAAERYDDNRTAAVFPTLTKHGTPHPLAGQPVTKEGRQLYHPSQRDIATIGAFWKMATDHTCRAKGIAGPGWANARYDERELVQNCVHKQAWTGLLAGSEENGDIKGEPLRSAKLTELQKKTLIADVNSGGLFAVPAAFDDAIVMYPILFGQLAPYVDMKDTNSNRVQGALMNRVRMTSGVIEGTGVTPFDTTGFLAAFDNPVWAAQGSMELGKDFEDDTPAAVGQTVVEMFGQESLAYLDRVIAYGDGRNEPLGICRTPGTFNVLSSYGPGGPMTVADFTNLQFGIDLAVRQEPNAYLCYISNDNMYRMSRNIQVGPNDERRVFGDKIQSYMMFDNPYAINNNIPNGIVGYANLRRYRMYRRLGIQITVDESGYTLRTRNTRLIVARIRYGGRLNYSGGACVMVDAQAQ